MHSEAIQWRVIQFDWLRHVGDVAAGNRNILLPASHLFFGDITYLKMLFKNDIDGLFTYVMRDVMGSLPKEKEHRKLLESGDLSWLAE